MGLKSDRDIQGQQTFRDIQSANVKINNPFENYNLRFKPLSAGDLNVSTEQYFSNAIENLRNLISRRRNEELRAITQRLINQNIAGGLRNAMQSRTASQFAQEEASGLSNLLGELARQKLQNLLTAQEQSRLYDLLSMQLLGQRTAVDQQNVSNLLNKLQLQGNTLQYLDDTTWLDDVLAIANTAGNLYKSVFGGG